MHYYIDGYNLMFSILRAGNDLQKQREFIIQSLHRKIQLVKINATIVFDAHYQSNDGSRSHRHPIEILFTQQGQTADEYILHKLKQESHPRQQTVVTSDKKLAWQARRLGAQTERVEDFISWLNKRCINKQKNKKTEKAPAPEQKKRVKDLQENPGTAVETPFEYYLEQFESRFQEISQPLPLKESSSSQQNKRRQIKKKKAPKENDGLSPWERWQKAFERNPDEDEIV